MDLPAVTARLKRVLRAIWIQFGIFLIAVVAVDLALRAYFYASARRQLDWRASAEGYKNFSWTAEYFADLSGFSIKWLPFAYWIGASYHSRYLNIGADGARRTFNASPFARGQSNPVRIFMFGGSTMWSEGARDDYTIPSWLQRFLDASHKRVRITNFGQDGYVSTQEMILLFELLQNGNVPDLVIFYDGFNDSGSAMVNGVAGSSFEEKNRRLEFRVFNQWATDDSLLYKQAAAAIVRHSGIGRLARKMLRRLAPGRFQELQGQMIAVDRNLAVAPGGENPALQDEVVRKYLANKRMVEAVGRSFGFECLFFWQPTVYTKANRTPYESKQGWLPGDREFLSGVHERLSRIAAKESIHDLSGVFGNSREPYFIDEAHITEAGDRVIAQAMLPYVLAVLEERRPQMPPPSNAGTARR